MCRRRRSCRQHLNSLWAEPWVYVRLNELNGLNEHLGSLSELKIGFLRLFRLDHCINSSSSSSRSKKCRAPSKQR